MIKILPFLQIFFILNAHSLEIECKFEEVYSDSSVQNGFLLIKGDKLRYEYYSENLFTLFHNNNQFLAVKNNDIKVINKISQNTEIIEELLYIAASFPDIKKEYDSGDLTVRMEKNHSGDFLKRISIISPNINMSIYFNQCNMLKISDRYFSHNPYFKYR